MFCRTDGVYASGHPELAQLYWQPILDGMAAARRGAADRAKANNLSHCAPTALHYNAHISPWGFGDFDVGVILGGFDSAPGSPVAGAAG